MVTLDEDGLGGASGANTVDGGLVQADDKGLVHGVVLVVSVKNNAVVALELGSKVLPPGLEVGGVGDDVVEVAAIVVGVQDGVGTLAGDVVDNAGEVLHVRSVEGTGHGAGVCSLHSELHSETVVALRDEGLWIVRCDHSMGWPNSHQQQRDQGR